MLDFSTSPLLLQLGADWRLERRGSVKLTSSEKERHSKEKHIFRFWLKNMKTEKGFLLLVNVNKMYICLKVRF